MSGDRDGSGDTPTGERIAGIRANIERLRERLHELQRNAPQPPPPLPPPPPATPIDEPAVADLHSGPASPTSNAVTLAMTAPIAAALSVAGPTSIVATAMPWTPARRARNGFQLALHLAQRPGFCCCCLCLGPLDTRRARRIFALVRAIKRRS